MLVVIRLQDLYLMYFYAIPSAKDLHQRARICGDLKLTLFSLARLPLLNLALLLGRHSYGFIYGVNIS